MLWIVSPFSQLCIFLFFLCCVSILWIALWFHSHRVYLCASLLHRFWPGAWGTWRPTSWLASHLPAWWWNAGARWCTPPSLRTSRRTQTSPALCCYSKWYGSFSFSTQKTSGWLTLHRYNSIGFSDFPQLIVVPVFSSTSFCPNRRCTPRPLFWRWWIIVHSAESLWSVSVPSIQWRSSAATRTATTTRWSCLPKVTKTLTKTLSLDCSIFSLTHSLDHSLDYAHIHTCSTCTTNTHTHARTHVRKHIHIHTHPPNAHTHVPTRKPSNSIYLLMCMFCSGDDFICPRRCGHNHRRQTHCKSWGT